MNDEVVLNLIFCIYSLMGFALVWGLSILFSFIGLYE